jgi:hypothetical protein
VVVAGVALGVSVAAGDGIVVSLKVSPASAALTEPSWFARSAAPLANVFPPLRSGPDAGAPLRSLTARSA